jgi:hypothetical protein
MNSLLITSGFEEKKFIAAITRKLNETAATVSLIMGRHVGHYNYALQIFLASQIDGSRRSSTNHARISAKMNATFYRLTQGIEKARWDQNARILEAAISQFGWKANKIH